MAKRLLLAAIILAMLLSPSFAEEYIISPPEELASVDVLPEVIAALSEDAAAHAGDIDAKALYGTDDVKATLTEEQAESLEGLGYEVYEDLKIHAFLNYTPSQVNVTPLWNTTESGFYLNGTGQSICLIDSGINDVNYTVFSNAWSNGKILGGWAFFTEDGIDYNQSCNSTNHTACFDDDGHGTTVAEVIVSNHSSYKGIAPGAKLIIAKVLNRTRDGTQSDLIQAINYCVNVSSGYNISVISISLGTEETSSVYCDSASWLAGSLKDAINNAASRNISVVAATGNEASSTNLSAPACLSNATPVSSVNKSDSIYSTANYWSLPVVFAPGAGIYFPGPGGSILSGTGTSYAAPHAAGVFAIISQYLSLTGQGKTPAELRALAVSTGKSLGANPNQTRINAFAMYDNLTEDFSVSISSPENNSFRNSSLLAVTGQSSSGNTTVYVYYGNGTLFSSTNTTSLSWSVNFTLQDGNYNITTSATNGVNTTNTTASNITIDTLAPNISINSPDSQYLTSRIIEINLTADDLNLNYTNISIYNSTGSIVNSTISSQNSNYLINLSVPLDGTYNITARAFDKAGNSDFDFVSAITVDSVIPQVTIISPSNNSVINTRSITINLTVNDSRLNYTNISIANSSGQIINSTINSTNGNYAPTLSVESDGVYGINATAYDNAGNLKTSSAVNLTVSTAPTLKARPQWTNQFYQGNYTISAGLSENLTNTRSLYLNLNQTKTLMIYLNNSGESALESVLANLSGFSGLNATLAWLDGQNLSIERNISANTTVALNLTINSPATAGAYEGSIIITTLNGGPYTTLNLTLNLSVTGQTLSWLNSSSGKYYANESNITGIGLYAYFYDNLTQASLWNGPYNFTLVNSTNSSVAVISMSQSGGLFLGLLNKSGIAEGSYNITEEFNDSANNTLSVNLALELYQNPGLSANLTTNENLIVKSTSFVFQVNVSKLGNFNLTNGTLCISAPGNLNYTTNPCFTGVNVSTGSARLYNWTMTGSPRGDYTVNVTFYTSDGKFNRTIQKAVTVRYGDLDFDWYSSTTPPSSVTKSQVFYVKAVVENNGNLNATSVSLDLGYNSNYFTLSSGSDPCTIGTLIPDDDETCQWTLTAKTSTVSDSPINVTISGSSTTLPSTTYLNRYVDVVNAEEEAATEAATTTTTAAANTTLTKNLIFTAPAEPEISLFQGQNLSFAVAVKNTGTSALANLYLEISGLNSSQYSIDSNTKSTLAAGASREFSVRLMAPPEMDAKIYPITIKALSDSSSWTKAINIAVKGISVELAGLENISVTQGETRMFLLSVKNTGTRDMNNARITISNITADSISISPDRASKIAQNSQQGFNLTIAIPQDEMIGEKSIILQIVSDEGNVSRKFSLRVVPCDEQKQGIEDTYKNLTEGFKSALKKYERLDPNKVNLSMVEEEMNLTNMTMAMINTSLERGDYAEAQRLLAQAQESLSKLDMALADVKLEGSSPSSMFLWAVFISGALLAAMAAYYAFMPKKKYGMRYFVTSKTPGSPEQITDAAQKTQVTPEQMGVSAKKKRGLWDYFKMSKKGGPAEKREKILEEWRERYELKKKQKPYGD